MIDKNKQYRTRDGREVRIYATDGIGSYPVHGACRGREGWTPEKWTAGGLFFYDGSRKDGDLVEVKPRIQREFWLNVYRDSLSTRYDSKEHADRGATIERLACVKIIIDCEEGEGL